MFYVRSWVKKPFFAQSILILYNRVVMKKQLLPLMVLAFSLGSGACSCSNTPASSSVDPNQFFALGDASFDSAIALYRKGLKGVVGQDQQGFDFTPSPLAKRGDTDYGFSVYSYPEEGASSSSDSAEPVLYGAEGTLEKMSFRANGMDALSAKDFVTSTKFTNLSLTPLAGLSESNGLSFSNQSPAIYTKNTEEGYREYLDLSNALLTKEAIETLVENAYDVESWVMPRRTYRELSSGEKSLVDSFFTGSKGPTDRLCDDVDAFADDMVDARSDALDKSQTSPLIIEKNGAGCYRLTYSPDTKRSARFLEGRIEASALPTVVQLALNNDISSFFEAVTTWKANFVFTFTAEGWTDLSLDLDCVADPEKIGKSETIGYVNDLGLLPMTIPDLRFSSFHLCGVVTPFKGDEAVVVLPDLTPYVVPTLPETAN
jgi:hypothetical protein